ncbi:MAG TPA: SRPBCC domain-containing protein [Candidatus Limnocylindria bacterium]|nr:SRPBCC domain-containing protein [Candidatus Limnocylindria bacterium]
MMHSNLLNRREVSVRLLSLLPVLGFAGKAGAVAVLEPVSDDLGISHNCECIHQEVVIKASRARVYQALTDAKQFSKVTDFSMPGVSTAISPEVGGTFSLFGGYISGRHIEMVPNERLVQAWRTQKFDPGIFTIANFQLHEEGAATKLVFDQTAIPQGHAEHLAEGWKSHYWEGLQKYLA